MLFSGSPCWVSADKTIDYRFVKRWSTKREQYEASVSSRCIATRDCEWRVAEPATSASNSHAYSRKYSRFVRLRLLGFKTPYFRNLPSKNNTQLFFSVVYRLRVNSFVVSAWLLIMVLLIKEQQGSQRKRQVVRPAFSLAPPAGLEPATS